MIELTESYVENLNGIVKGLRVYCNSNLPSDVLQTFSQNPNSNIGNAFNANQVSSKLWAKSALFETLGGIHPEILIVGGWYAVFALLIFDDSRFLVNRIVSCDIDPAVQNVAITLNRRNAAKFTAVTGDMYNLKYSRRQLVVNTCCEHISDLSSWISLIPEGTPVVLQSNNFYAEDTHISCSSSSEQFRDTAGLSEVYFCGDLQQTQYSRFMLIGRV